MDSIFKIVFSKGDPIQSNLTFFGVSMDTIFTVFITLLVFFLGFVFNKHVERRRRFNRLKELEEFFFQMLFLLQKPVQRQIEELRKFSQVLLEKKEQNMAFVVATNFVIKQIQDFNNEDLYSIIVRNKKGDLEGRTQLYSLVRTQCAFIDEKNESIKSDFVSFYTPYEKYVVDYKSSLKSLMDLFLTMYSNPQFEKSPFLIDFNNLAQVWQQQENSSDLFVSKIHLIDKAQKLLQNSTSSPLLAIFNRYIMDCKYNYNNIIHLKNSYSETFELSANDLEKSMGKISQAIDTMSKQ